MPVDFPGIVGLDDVWVGQLANGPHLPREAAKVGGLPPARGRGS